MKPRTPTKKTPKPKARKKPAKTPTTYRRKGIDDQQMDPNPPPWPPPRQM